MQQEQQNTHAIKLLGVGKDWAESLFNIKMQPKALLCEENASYAAFSS